MKQDYIYIVISRTPSKFAKLIRKTMGIEYNHASISLDEDLEEILVDAIEHPSKYVEMGRRAKDYYDNNATPLHMANGAIRAIECAMSKNIEC